MPGLGLNLTDLGLAGAATNTWENNRADPNLSIRTCFAFPRFWPMVPASMTNKNSLTRFPSARVVLVYVYVDVYNCARSGISLVPLPCAFWLELGRARREASAMDPDSRRGGPPTTCRQHIEHAQQDQESQAGPAASAIHTPRAGQHTLTVEASSKGDGLTLDLPKDDLVRSPFTNWEDFAGNEPRDPDEHPTPAAETTREKSYKDRIWGTPPGVLRFKDQKWEESPECGPAECGSEKRQQ